MSDTTDLVPLNNDNAIEYFKPNGLDPIIEKIRKQVAELKPDTSTDKGRKEISSNARKVASAKVALDNIRKELVSGEKARLKAIDAEGGRAWDILEELQKEVRKPLDEWEAIDEKRVDAHKLALDHINSLQLVFESTAAIDLALEHIAKYREHDFEEFSDLAKTNLDNTYEQLTKKREEMIKRDQERAELEKLRKEAEDRRIKDAEEQAKRDAEKAKAEQAEREEKIRQEATAEAERKAKEKAESDRLESERKAQEAIDQAKREKEDADRRSQAAADQAKAAAEKAERDRIEAEEKAKRDKEAAVQAERDRQEKIRQDEAIENAKREANKKHCAKINNEARFALQDHIDKSIEDMAHYTTNDIAKTAIEAIAKGLIPHVKINY